MRKEDKEPDKRYFRSSDRFVRLNGEWYFSTREGDCGPFRDEKTAQRELQRYIVSQQDLKNFQRGREAWCAKREARMRPRRVTGDGLFSLDSIVD
ncbi:MAG: DUF6316 family protein [Pseudomonadales bacterium]